MSEIQVATPTIAVVDDEESIRLALARLIRSSGFRVATFASGADFLRSLKPNPPRCVVIDLHMPHINGFDVQQALAKVETSVPVVMITGDDSADSQQRALANGAHAYLRKPIDDATLLQAIRTALERQQ